MTQGAVKTTGKRSRAVSAKKKRFLAQHWTLFHNSVFTAQGWSRSRSWRVFQNQSAVLLSVKRGAVYSRTAADSRYLAGTVKSVSRRFRPAGGDQRVHPSEAGSFRDYPQASRLFCMEMLAGAPLLMDELTGDLKALIDEKSALIAGWVKSGKLAPIDPQHLIFMIWASTQHYADFAPQVEAVTGATLRDEVFFNQTVENVQRIIIEGIRPR